MKIAALIRSRPHTRYFVNQIHKAHELSLVVVEAPRTSKKLSTVLKKQGVHGLIRTVFLRYASQKRAEHLNHTFGENWKHIDPSIPVVVASSVNDPEVHDRLRGLAPDLLLDHGTSIVRGHILDTAGLALNLHWGLSPYYKGVACTEWALINWDPYNIGVTIHLLSKHIDGGHIVAQERVEVKPADRVEHINHRMTVEGTKLVRSIIARLREGEVLDYVPQPPEEGQLFLKMHYGKHLRQQVKHIERRGMVAHMLSKPSRKGRLPIVTLSNQYR